MDMNKQMEQQKIKTHGADLSTNLLRLPVYHKGTKQANNVPTPQRMGCSCVIEHTHHTPFLTEFNT